ncbi:MAG: hypothetical protein COV44_11885 [Deltaproteobacteria bacterium CG11_big_fil_rev_8_21_14_0_20_45_16]|nr:MAG: hypothetical protein COV44_11885 [Deltaproteobacteria bacterium CG11_big_fil_rev_8_21_14_0_20_45_16]
MRAVSAQSTECLELIELAERHIKDDKKNEVPYLSSDEQDQIRLKLVDGVYVNSDGSLADIRGMKLMIVEKDGSILADWANSRDPFHHSSLAAGGSVAMAGWVSIKNGKPSLVTNTSGHYTPSLERLRSLLIFWKSRVVDLNDMEVGVRVAITSSLASTFYYTFPALDFLDLMEFHPKDAKGLLKLIIESDLNLTKRAMAIAHLYMIDGAISEEELSLLRTVVGAGDRQVISDIFDLLPSDHFEKLLNSLSDLEFPELKSLRDQFEELKLERH